MAEIEEDERKLLAGKDKNTEMRVLQTNNLLCLIAADWLECELLPLAKSEYRLRLWPIAFKIGRKDSSECKSGDLRMLTCIGPPYTSDM